MDDKYNQIKAFQQAEMMIHVITNDEYFYGGHVIDVYNDYFIINDQKIGKMPISFSSIKKLTKYIIRSHN